MFGNKLMCENVLLYYSKTRKLQPNHEKIPMKAIPPIEAKLAWNI